MGPETPDPENFAGKQNHAGAGATVKFCLEPKPSKRDFSIDYYRFQLRGDLFFDYRYFLNRKIDQDETWASVCDLIFNNILL